MRHRDAHGRFRKATDEERWPDQAERERIQRIRALLTPPPWLMQEYKRMMEQGLRDIAFVAGDRW